MGKIEGDLVSSCTGSVSNISKASSSKPIVSSSAASIRSARSAASNSSTYTTRSGYAMSTSFSDNIKFGKKKPKTKKRADSDNLSIRPISTTSSVTSSRSSSSSSSSSNKSIQTTTATPLHRKSIAELKQERRRQQLHKITPEKQKVMQQSQPNVSGLKPTPSQSLPGPPTIKTTATGGSNSAGGGASSTDTATATATATTYLHCRSLPISSPRAQPSNGDSEPFHINETFPPLSSSSSSIDNKDKMFESKHRPIMITSEEMNNEDTNSIVTKASMSTMTSAKTVTTNNNTSGFWRFKRNKPQPEMISSSDLTKDSSSLSLPLTSPSSPLDNNNTNNNDDNSGIYPVFKLPLEQAIKFNTPFESTDIFARSDTIDSEICDLEYQKYVPLIVLKCIKFIVKHGLDEEGLYRVGGSTQDIKRLQRRFMMEGPVFDIDESNEEIHTVTSLFKLYLRELPEDLVTVTKHHYLAYDPSSMMMMQSQHQSEEEDRLQYQNIPVQVLQEELVNLPFVSFALLHVLIRHFSMVVKHEENNRMSLSNLAVVFAPTLRMNKILFMALVSRGDLLWKDLHPTTPKPVMDPTFNSVEPYASDKIIDENLDKMYAQFDFYQPQPLQHHHHSPSPKAHHQTMQSFSSAPPATGSRPLMGMGINTINESPETEYHQRFNSTDKLTMSSSISSRSLRSLDSSPETVMTEPDYETPFMHHQHQYRKQQALTIDVNRAKYNHGFYQPQPSYSKYGNNNAAARSPRALFLRPSTPHSSMSAPTTPAAPTHMH